MSYSKQKSKRRQTIRKMRPQYGNALQVKRRNKKKHQNKSLDLSNCSSNEKFYLTRCKGKSVYMTKDEAITGAISASRLIGSCRIYQCPLCGHYHLTTQVEEGA